MEISQISFCNKIGYNVTNDKEKEYIVEHFISKYDIELNTFNMYYYSDKFLNYFKKFTYLLSLESNGNKYYLLLITIKNEKYSIFVDTKTTKTHAFPKMIIVPFRFNDELYNGTIIEGSLIRDKHKQWAFLWEDIIVYKGRRYNESIIDTYTLMHNIVENDYIEDLSIQVCPIHIKRLFTFDQIDYIFTTYIHSLHYNINGLIFHPMNANNKSIIFYFNLSKHMKNNERTVMNFERSKTATPKPTPTRPKPTRPKPIQSKSTDKSVTTMPVSTSTYKTFIIKPSKRTLYIYNLYAIDDNHKIKKHSIARIDTIEKKGWIEHELSKCSKHLFVECLYAEAFGKWVPQRVSSQDKLSNMRDI